MSSPRNMLRSPRRSAAPSIAGYYYQLLHTMRCWTALKENEVLWCEGNEDVDIHLTDGVRVEQQIKLLTGSVSASSRSVRKVLGEFIKGFVYHKKQGQAVHFVFKTSACLAPRGGRKLRAWLKGESFDVSEVIHAVSKLMALGRDAGAIEALDELKRKSWDEEFLRSVQCVFGECTLEALREQVVTLLSEDPRCTGVSAETLFEKMLHRVLQASVARALEGRVLTSLDFRTLINDALIERLCTFSLDGMNAVGAMFLAVRRKGDEVCAIVVRFSDRDVAINRLSAALQSVMSHPDDQDTLRPSDAWDSPRMRDELRKVDFDVFGAMTRFDKEEPSLSDWHAVIRFSAGMARVRADSDDLICNDEAHEICTKLHLPEFRLRQVLAPNFCMQLAECFAAWVLERSTELDALSRKFRCLADLQRQIYFTQDNPVRASLLAL